jgi:type I restriction enzyme S subunit
MSDDATLDEFGGNNEESANLELGPINIDIPSGWNSAELRDVFDIISGNNYTGDYLSEDDNGGKIFLTLKSVSKGGGFNWDSIKYYTGDVNEREMVESGDLLIANTDVTQDGDVVGYSIQVPEFNQERKIAASMDLSILRPYDNSVNVPYIKYLLQTEHIHSRMRAFSAGSTVLHLNTDLAQRLSLPLPPLSEQRKIATVLHTVDQAIQKTEEIIGQFERVHQGLFQNLIPRGIGHDEYDNVRILGRTVQIPSTWEITTVSQACSNIIDYRGKNPDFSEEGIPHLRNINISQGKIIFDDIKYVSQETYDEWMTRGIPEEGDTLLSTEAPMGKTAVLPDLKFSLSQRLIVLSPGNQFDSRFFAHLMGSPFVQKEYDARATGSTVKGISNYNLQEVTIPVPPNEEQEQIAQYIDDTLEAIQKNEQRVKRLQRLKQGLMQDLLSGEVRTTDADIDIPEEVAKYG